MNTKKWKVSLNLEPQLTHRTLNLHKKLSTARVYSNIINESGYFCSTSSVSNTKWQCTYKKMQHIYLYKLHCFQFLNQPLTPPPPPPPRLFSPPYSPTLMTHSHSWPLRHAKQHATTIYMAQNHTWTLTVAVQFSSLQFKMVSMHSEKPRCAQAHLSEVYPVYVHTHCW